jgi:hypothetical protein
MLVEPSILFQQKICWPNTDEARSKRWTAFLNQVESRRTNPNVTAAQATASLLPRLRTMRLPVQV